MRPLRVKRTQRPYPQMQMQIQMEMEMEMAARTAVLVGQTLFYQKIISAAIWQIEHVSNLRAWIY